MGQSDQDARNQRYQRGGAPAPQTEDDTTLVGSSVQPSTFKLADGTELQLGDVVRRAYEASGMATAKEWNDLPGETQEHFIQAEVDKLDLAKPEKPEGTGDGANIHGLGPDVGNGPNPNYQEPKAEKKGWFGSRK